MVLYLGSLNTFWNYLNLLATNHLIILNNADIDTLILFMYQQMINSNSSGVVHILSNAEVYLCFDYIIPFVLVI